MTSQNKNISIWYRWTNADTAADRDGAYESSQARAKSKEYNDLMVNNPSYGNKSSEI